MTDKMDKKIVNLKHGDLVILNGRKGEVGTIGGYAVEYQEKPAAAIERAQGQPPNKGCLNGWINQEAGCICGDPGYYEQERAKWAKAITLESGQYVWLDGKLLTVKYKGNYSDMATFEEVK
jgi:hypothetical protein